MIDFPFACDPDSTEQVARVIVGYCRDHFPTRTRAAAAFGMKPGSFDQFMGCWRRPNTGMLVAVGWVQTGHNDFPFYQPGPQSYQPRPFHPAPSRRHPFVNDLFPADAAQAVHDDRLEQGWLREIERTRKLMRVIIQPRRDPLVSALFGEARP